MTNKQKAVLFSAIAIVGAAGGYLIYRLTRKKELGQSEPMESRRGNEYHHATNVFARAKQSSGQREEY